MNPNEHEETIKVNQGLTLIQKKNGLKFGTDALLLSAFLGCHGEGTKAIELGCGTGIISLLALKRGQIGSVIALEVQSAYADLTRRNAELNALSSRLSVVCTDLRDYRRCEQADLVFTNPPYMKADSGKINAHEEKYIARHEARGTIEEFCLCGAGMLKFGGSFYVVYRPDRLPDLICALRGARLEPKRMLFAAQSPAHAPALVLIEAKKGASSGCILQKPFFFKNPDGSDTAAYKALMQKGMITKL